MPDLPDPTSRAAGTEADAERKRMIDLEVGPRGWLPRLGLVQTRVLIFSG